MHWRLYFKRRNSPTPMKRAFVVSSLLFGNICLAYQSDPIKQEYREAKEALLSHTDGFGIDGDPKAPELLDREWTLTGAWIAHYLDTHRNTGSEQLAAAIKELDPALESNAVQLEGNTYVIATSDAEIGTAFIISHVDGAFKVVWDIKDAAATHVEQRAVLTRWSAHGTMEGGISGRVGKLPKSGRGRARFYLDATYAQAAGGTGGAQLSVWEWNGIDASPILVKRYSYLRGTPGTGAIFDGDLLRVHGKGSFKTLFSCGGCKDPEVELRLRVTPEKIVDLGQQSLVPELDVIDGLFYKLQRRMSVADVAAPQVATALASTISGVRADPDVKKNDYASLGMLFDSKVRHDAKESKVCLEADGPGRYLFTLVPRNGKSFVADVKEISDVRFGQSCADVLSRRP